jgi:hypothetical protein
MSSTENSGAFTCRGEDATSVPNAIRVVLPNSPLRATTLWKLLGWLIWYSAAMGGLCAADRQPPLLGSGTRALTYRSLLDNSCVIQNAVFEKEVFLSGIPPAARKQTFSLKLSGGDYMLSVVQAGTGAETGVHVGHFRGLAWEASNGDLTLFDPDLNKKPAAVAGTEAVTRMTANLFMNLGITEMVRHTAVWDDTQSRIVAQSTGGGEILVEFEREVGATVPARAAIRHAPGGEEYAYVRFRYDPKVYGGKVPIEFTRFHVGAPTEEVGKMFTVRLLKLELAERPLPAEALDPRKALTYKSSLVYSNDALYWIRKSGSPQRVLTSDEVRKKIGRRHSPVIARCVVGVLLLVVSVCTAVYLVRSNISTKQNK